MKVKFVPQNVELEIKPNESVLHLAHDNGLHIKSVCKGVPSCSECRVRVTQGDYNVLPPSQKELNLIGNSWKIDGRRLSCQLKCFGDITVDLTEQIAKEHTTTKRPRGGPTGAQDDLEAPRESSAVLGAIMLEDSTQEILKKVDAEPPRQQHARNDRSQQGGQQHGGNNRGREGNRNATGSDRGRDVNRNSGAPDRGRDDRNSSNGGANNRGGNDRPQQGRPQQNANQRNDQGGGRGPQGGGNNTSGGGQRNNSGGNRNNNGGGRRGGGSGNSR